MSSKFFGNRLAKNTPKQTNKKAVNNKNVAKRSTAVRKSGRGK
ncbi:MAG: hypothetical protein P8L83_00380 [Flavobacteriaceae bacterium]|nr:hypothetical protein [Flavobacteriaceae bacterium]